MYFWLCPTHSHVTGGFEAVVFIGQIPFLSLNHQHRSTECIGMVCVDNVDSIEANIETTSVSVDEGIEQLRQARRSQVRSATDGHLVSLYIRNISKFVVDPDCIQPGSSFQLQSADVHEHISFL